MERQGAKARVHATAFPQNAGIRRELPLDAALGPHPALSPSQLTPTHPTRSHLSSSHPIPTLPSYGSPSPGHVGQQPTTLGTLGDILLPFQMLHQCHRKEPTAAFVCRGSLDLIQSGQTPIEWAPNPSGFWCRKELLRGLFLCRE